MQAWLDYNAVVGSHPRLQAVLAGMAECRGYVFGEMGAEACKAICDWNMVRRAPLPRRSPRGGGGVLTPAAAPELTIGLAPTLWGWPVSGEE